MQLRVYDNLQQSICDMSNISLGGGYSYSVVTVALIMEFHYHHVIISWQEVHKKFH